LLGRAATVDPCLPSLLGFLYSLLAIPAPVISSSATVVAEFLPTGILDKLLVAFSALGHVDIPFHFHLTNPIDYHRKRNMSRTKLIVRTEIHSIQNKITYYLAFF
jgi:hypothetical protein